MIEVTFEEKPGYIKLYRQYERTLYLKEIHVWSKQEAEQLIKDLQDKLKYF